MISVSESAVSRPLQPQGTMTCQPMNEARPMSKPAANTSLGAQDVVVRRQWLVGPDIKVIELAAANGATLPSVDAGAHIDLHLPDGIIRQYSVTAPGPTPASYLIGILREPDSRGGSSYLVDHLQTGDSLSITGPRNNFPLDEAGTSYRLIAGGIGVTPMLAMARQLVERERPVEFHYLVRSRERAVFLGELTALLPAASLHLHVSSETGRPDLETIIGDAGHGHHIYICGPEPLLTAIREATNDWPAERVQFESFQNTALSEQADEPETGQACHVELKQSGVSFDLEAGETLLEALERQQLDMPCLCREGICGTCAVGVLEGSVDHRDALQDDDEKAQNDLMYVCVSRPTGSRLVLDL